MMLEETETVVLVHFCERARPVKFRGGRKSLLNRSNLLFLDVFDSDSIGLSGQPRSCH